MGRHIVNFPDLVIPAAGTDSNVISSKLGFGHLVDLIIWAHTLTNEVSLLVGQDEGMAIGDMEILTLAGTDFTITANRANQIPAAAYKSLAVQSAGAEAAARTFQIRGQEDMA